MAKELAVAKQASVPGFAAMTDEQVALLKRTVARGATDDELAMFLHICERTGLDPFAKQIYAVKRYDSSLRREVMAVQTGIDGYRLVAERTGRYAPGREPDFDYDTTGVRERGDKGTVHRATAFVKKQTKDGTWHEVAASAHFSEYVQRTREGAPTKFWRDMPHVMLAKVAEALALRRAFPMELSGVYTHEEMAQADTTADVASSKYMQPRRLDAPKEPQDGAGWGEGPAVPVARQDDDYEAHVADALEAAGGRTRWQDLAHKLSPEEQAAIHAETQREVAGMDATDADAQIGFLPPEMTPPTEGETPNWLTPEDETLLPISREEVVELKKAQRESGKTDKRVKDYCRIKYGVTSAKDVTRRDYPAIMEWLREGV